MAAFWRRSFEGSSCECAAVPQESDLASVIVGAIQVIFTAAAALIMDKAGRKFLLIISGTLRHQENRSLVSFQRMHMRPFWSQSFGDY